MLFIQPVFMASNIIVARGGVEYVPPVSLAFWRWITVFLILFPFFFNEIIKKKKQFKKESFKLTRLEQTCLQVTPDHYCKKYVYCKNCHEPAAPFPFFWFLAFPFLLLKSSPRRERGGLQLRFQLLSLLVDRFLLSFVLRPDMRPQTIAT